MFEQMVGKTIKSVDTQCVNMIVITFTDGEVVEIYAECGSSKISIPFFDVCWQDNRNDL